MKNRIGIVRETKNEWECRVPLTPDDLAGLIKKNQIEATVQPSKRRIFSDDAYRKIGAAVDDDLSPCRVIMGIKEIKTEDLIPEKTYLYFSHTIKGQSYNMEMLQKLLDLKCTLIDYERMVNEDDQRLIYFSYHAGVAGMIDTFWSYGQRLEMEGIDSPFSLIRQTLDYADQSAAEKDFARLGEKIIKEGLPLEITPLVIGVTGYGNVSRGAQDMLEFLPITEITPREIFSVRERDADHSRTIYKVVFGEEDMYAPLSEKPFDLQDYYYHPENYRADFARYLSGLSILVNATFWDTPYPRHVTNQDLKNLYAGKTPPTLRVIGDISCDIEGGIECTIKATDPGNPVFVYEPATDTYHDGVKGNGPVIMSVDNLPSELPRDASVYFSSVLKDFVPALAAADFDRDFDDLDLPFPLKKAVIVHKGRLTSEYIYLEDYLG